MDYHVSDVASHNSKEYGYWISLGERIYDVTHFMEKHPGGRVILMNSAGRDASAEFKSISHHGNPRIEALLHKLYVGRLLAVNFSNSMLQCLYGKWLELLYLVLEMENTLHCDLSFLDKACTVDDDCRVLSPYKIDLLLETHSRFVNGYLGLIIDKLEKIRILTGDLAPQSPAKVPSVPGSVTDLLETNRSIARIRENNASVRRNDAIRRVERWDTEIQAYRLLVEKEDAGLLAAIKQAMIGGLKVFESPCVGINAAALIPFYSLIDDMLAQYSEEIEAGSHTISLECGQIELST